MPARPISQAHAAPAVDGAVAFFRMSLSRRKKTTRRAGLFLELSRGGDPFDYVNMLPGC
jgi:hypothetical protein